MKVNGNSQVPPIYEMTKSQRQTEQPGSSGENQSDQVKISPDAQWISELRAEARRQPAVRSELVNEVRAQLDAGTFEQSVDMDAVLEGLLADL